MQPVVIIHHIGRKEVLKNDEFQFIVENLHKPLAVASMHWNKEGELCLLTLFHKDTVLTLFNSNIIEGEFTDGTEFHL